MIGSLFSGAGGLDMAVQAVFGGDIVWHAEIDKAASKVLAHRFPVSRTRATSARWIGLMCLRWTCCAEGFPVRT